MHSPNHKILCRRIVYRLINDSSLGIVIKSDHHPIIECCDPYKAGWVDSTDQLVPYLTTIIFKKSPGLAGLYVSAVFCGTLSTVSSGINSMSTCLVTDFIKLNENRIFSTVKSEKFYALLGKIACVFFGLC